MKNKFLIVSILFLLVWPVKKMCGQENIGMASGNYAGISSVWYNPANIADNRYKFDINIIGYNSYFNNNYLLVKNGTLLRRMFYKEPYNSSFTAVKKDLLQEQLPIEGNVFARTETNIHFPLSFMFTTGKKSAVAITMNNRTINKIDNLNPNVSRLFFNELREPSLYGKDYRIDSMQYSFLNWQEVGFTYSRVIVKSDNHFLKMGVTLKWLGANAAAYIQTDKATVNFKDSQTVSINSPLIHYYRTARADIGQFKRTDLFNNIEDQSFGWDAGLVYEFRARVKKFKYINEDMQEQQRLDLNKYTFRIGLALVDMGSFTLQKKPLTNDHGANIVNWDFSNVKASDFTNFDSAYSKKVNYLAGAKSTFTYRLPAALIANFDLHIFGGLYINVAVKAPFENAGKNYDAAIASNKWVAITPRFETQFLGIYVPVIRAGNRTNIGATIKIGPVYFGSNNLAELLTNKSTMEADFHAGARFSIPYGKPSNKPSKFIEQLLKGKNENAAYPNLLQQQIDSLKRAIATIKNNSKRADTPKVVQVIINNYGVTSNVLTQENDSVVISNYPSAKQTTTVYNNVTAENTDTLMRRLTEKNIEISKLQVAIEREETAAQKKLTKQQKKEAEELAKRNRGQEKQFQKEIDNINKQLAIQNAAAIGVGVITATNKNKKQTDTLKNKADSITIKDTVMVNHIDTVMMLQKSDTVTIRDTIIVKDERSDVAFRLSDLPQFNPIFFASGSAAINKADAERLKQLAVALNINEKLLVEINAKTDATGTKSVNRKMAAARIASVKALLLKGGVKDEQVLLRSAPVIASSGPDKNERRVEIRVLQQ